MADTKQLTELLQKQMEDGRKQTEALIAAFMGQTSKRETELPSQKVAIPSFDAFDSTIELWDDYWARFQTFIGANSVPGEKRALVFLTNQSRVNFKLLSNLASQQSPRMLTPSRWTRSSSI